jgi:hypothetical protein
VKSLATVLIAEENQSVAAELRSTIRQHCPACPVMTVANGDHAMAYLRGTARAARSVKFPITPLLFLSLTIPQVSALQILDWVKRQFALRTLIIGLLCGVGEIPDFERLTGYGAHAVVNKTALAWQVAQLLAAVENGRPVTQPLLLAASEGAPPCPLGLSAHAATAGDVAAPQLLSDLVLLTNAPPVAT